ncbi:MAG: cysteine--tRNA ligase [Nanoarchaeota archaeon]
MIKLYNTLTRKKEIFKPLKDNLVRLYTCGPTVYQYAHIGNLRTYIFEDLLKRTLLYNKLKIKHVMNITDVGHLTSDADTGRDKLEESAKKQQKSAYEIAKFYTNAFKKDIKKLNILYPNIWCKATNHIKDMQNWIKKLMNLGYTYEIEDGIYFDTSKFRNYGALDKKNIQGLQAGKRVDVKDKKHPTDFALWKFSPKDEKRQMEWAFLGKKGFPGWHIECSVMATKYLGKQFDIHCGGRDHIQIHHTNEIAQTEAITKKRWVNFWIHGEFLVLEKEKMAKSLGNFITLDTLEKNKFNPLDYRYLCLNTHYRKRLVFSLENLKSAKNSFERLKNIIMGLRNKKDSKGSVISYKIKFLEAINNDLNISVTLALLWNALRDKNLGSKEKYNLALEFDKVLGLNLKNIKLEEKIPNEIIKLANDREKARKSKNYNKADKLRQEIKAKGYLIEDTISGYIIKKA